MSTWSHGLWVGRAVSAIALTLVAAVPARAEWQLKPFLGVTFGGDTTFILTEARSKISFGASGVLLGPVLGVEAQVERIPGLFQDAATNVVPYVAGSSATVVTGNIVVALPRRLTGYTLRPYMIAGGGMMHTSIDPKLGGLPVASTLSAIDFGGGVTGFLTDRIGLSWEGRWFRSVAGGVHGVSNGNEELSFWRASMAVVIRLTRSTQ